MSSRSWWRLSSGSWWCEGAVALLSCNILQPDNAKKANVLVRKLVAFFGAVALAALFHVMLGCFYLCLCEAACCGIFLHAAALLYCMSYCSIGVAPPAGCHCWHSAPQPMLFAMVPLLHDAVVQLVGLHLCWLVFTARQDANAKKQQSNRHHPEAGGIWRLVVAGMPPLPWLG